MRIYIQASDYEAWKIIRDGPYIPTKIVKETKVSKSEEEWDTQDSRLIQLNAKAINMLYCALDANEFNRISACESAKEMWDKLEVTYEGTNQVKESKISRLVHEYELFCMKPEESISEMFTRFTIIINSLKALGKCYTNVENVRKILRSLPKHWDAKVTAIEEAKDLTKVSLDELLGSLMTHEIMLKGREEEAKPKRSLALKSSHQESEEEEEESGDDKEMALLTKRFKRFMRKEKSFNKKYNNKEVPKGEPSKRDPPTCFECHKPGHYKSDCPRLNKEGKKFKRKALKVTWDDSEGSESEQEESENEMANFCLMAKGDEVNLLNNDDELYSYEELQDAYNELYENTIKLHAKYKTLKKKETEFLNEIITLKNENENLLKNNNNITSKIKSSMVIEEENTKLKEIIKDLNKTLAKFVNGKENLDMLLGRQKCVFNKEGLGYAPKNKQKFYKNFFVKESSFNSSFTANKSYGRNRHIADTYHMKKDIYKINYKEPNLKIINHWNTYKAWVPKQNNVFKANLHGPKKIWVPKRII